MDYLAFLEHRAIYDTFWANVAGLDLDLMDEIEECEGDDALIVRIMDRAMIEGVRA